MGKLVKLLGSGIGFTSEAIHAARARSRSQSEQASSSGSHVPPATDSLRYAEGADEGAANILARSDRLGHDDEKQKSKASEAGYASDGDSSDVDDLGGFNDDEAAWELDEMAERMLPPTYEEATITSPTEPEDIKVKNEEATVQDLVRRAGPTPHPVQRLPCPVILPQRRPRQKDRGFVRAYAPILADCGIGQDVFLQFLETWDKTSKASPWIDVVFVAAGIAGFVPELAAQVVGTVVQVAAGTARELQSRHRRNTFLDRVNEDLFMPRGLYAMVMTFKDQVPGQQRGILGKLSSTLGQTLFASEKLDVNETAAKFSNPDPNMSKMKKGLRDIRLTNGKTYGEIELPEAAELVYPSLDRAAVQALDGDIKGKEAAGTREKLKSAGAWVQDYLDRRAQAFYESEHQGSSLAVPGSQRSALVSRYNDPNHPANSGSLISLLTGGAVNPAARREQRRALKQERRELRREHKDARRVSRGRSPRGPRKTRTPKRQRQGIIKKILQQDVLYLIIVNLPSQEEIQESVTRLESMVQQAGASPAY